MGDWALTINIYLCQTLASLLSLEVELVLGFGFFFSKTFLPAFGYRRNRTQLSGFPTRPHASMHGGVVEWMGVRA